MPVYVFECEACGERFDELQSFSSPPPPCPGCRAEATRRVLASFGGLGGRSAAPSTFTPAATRGCGTGCGCGHRH